MSKPRYSLRVRTDVDSPHVTVWLIRADGAARAGLLHGTLTAAEADELIEALELPAERGDCPYPPPALPHPNEAAVERQKTLFETESP